MLLGEPSRRTCTRLHHAKITSAPTRTGARFRISQVKYRIQRVGDTGLNQYLPAFAELSATCDATL
jgi:sorbitol-specific phosphotransferase system component IIA